MSATAYNSKNPHLWLVRLLDEDERDKRTARADKRCRFGHEHSWAFEVDMDAKSNTGWLRCMNCTAIEWDGEPA